jgi:hypothetical protein
LTLYKSLDIFFLVFHSILVLFNTFGWAYKPLRKLNLITLLLTGGSWFILGIFYGMGYCPLTDWHFNVLDKLNRNPETNSYIDYLLDRIFNLNLSESLVDTLTVSFFFIALLISTFLNFRKKLN